MADYEVIVIGGGPAGLSCAIMLQKSGIETCLIEKKEYPREKLCGGLITEKTYNLLLELFDNNIELVKPLFVDTTKSVSLWDNKTRKASVSVMREFRIVERKNFDDALKNHLAQNGGIIHDGETVISVDFQKKLVCSTLDNYHYQLLIVADGVNSVIRKQAGLSLSNIGFCLETSIPKEELNMNSEIQIRFNVLEQGYGWVFPCGDYFKVGFGNAYNSTTDYKKNFIEYLDTLGIVEPKKYNIKGAFIPYGDCLDNSILDDSVIFMGDSAGMVDPIYGEGLYYALSSGKNLIKSIEKKGNSISLLPEELRVTRKKEADQIKFGKKLRDLFYRPGFQRLFMKQIEKHNHFVCFFLDSQVSLYQYKYSKMWKMLFDYLIKERVKRHVAHKAL